MAHNSASRAELAARNRRRRKYALDEHYFDQIDTPEKAYWLGFLAGDGNVSKRGEITLGLTWSDAAHVAAFAAAVQTDAPVLHQHYWAKGKMRERARLTLNCTYMAEALIRHGIVLRKSLFLEPWRGPDHLIRHYWRGLVDADGTISAVRPWGVRLVGTEAIAVAFCGWARSVRPSIKGRATRQRGTLWGFGVSGRLGAQAIVRALYEDCTVALPRKAQRAAVIIATGPTVIGTPEWRERHIAIRKGQVPSQANRDAHRTPAAREKAKQRMLGRKASAETRRKMSESHRRRLAALRVPPEQTGLW